MYKHIITIYGPGCARCEELYRTASQVANSLPGEYTVQKETDANRMAEAGVLSTPGLALDGQLLSSGKVLSPVELKRLLAGELGIGEDAPAGCCCKGEPAAPGMPLWKKAALWGVVLFAAVCGIRHMNKQQAHESAPAAQPTATAGSAQMVYYTFGARCPTCRRMEQWTKQAVETEFAAETASGQLAFSTREADAAAVRQYGLTTKTLILQRGKTVRKLERIWELIGDEAAFKAYVTRETRNFLSGHE